MKPAQHCESGIDFAAMPTLGAIPAYFAARAPGKVALKFEGRETSWSELDLRSNRVANALLAAGLEAGARIGFAGKASDRFFELMFGVAKAGMVLVPAQWRLSPSEIDVTFRDSEVSLVFVAQDQFDAAACYAPHGDRQGCIALEPGSEFKSFGAWLADASQDPPTVEPSSDSVAVHLYTSGTTGVPKGVMLTHDNLLAGRCESMKHAMPWNEWQEGDVNLVALPLGHIGGLGWAIVGLFNGATTVVHRELKARAVLKALVEDKVSKIFIVPTALQMLLLEPDVRDLEFPNLRYILYGASPIALDLLREATKVFGCGFCQQYGMTETCGTIVYLPPEDHDPEGNMRMRAAGKPMPGVELRVVHPVERTILPAREVGEVETRSVYNMAGYWRKPEETAQTVDAEGWLRTGDAGYLDEDGYLFIHDRFKDLIISGAENIYPAEVESAIYGHPAVQEVAVFGVPDEKWGEAVKAAIVLKPGETANANDILEFTRGRIAGFKLPKSIDFLQALPKNPSGKLLRRELRDPYWAGRQRPVN